MGGKLHRRYILYDYIRYGDLKTPLHQKTKIWPRVLQISLLQDKLNLSFSVILPWRGDLWRSSVHLRKVAEQVYWNGPLHFRKITECADLTIHSLLAPWSWKTWAVVNEPSHSFLLNWTPTPKLWTLFNLVSTAYLHYSSDTMLFNPLIVFGQVSNP